MPDYASIRIESWASSDFADLSSMPVASVHKEIMLCICCVKYKEMSPRPRATRKLQRKLPHPGSNKS